MTFTKVRLPETERVRVEYAPAKHKGKWIKIRRTGQCALCPATWALTKHHLFGNGDGLTVVLCRNCHHCIHGEVISGMVGPFGRHLFQMLAQLFPITDGLPEWSER